MNAFLRKPAVTVHLIEAGGRRHTLQMPAGQSLMRAATDHGIEAIAADCGGSLSCATCHVHVDADWVDRLPSPSADEAAMLEMTAVPRTAASRLSCQIVVTPALDGLQVTIPERQY